MVIDSLDKKSNDSIELVCKSLEIQIMLDGSFKKV